MTVSDPAVATILHNSETGGVMSAIRHTLLTGILFGATGVYVAAIGLLLMLQERAIIVGIMNLGHATLIAIGLAAGLVAARGQDPVAVRLLRGLSAGAVAGALLAMLPILMSAVSLRWMFIALSPQLLQMLTFDAGVPAGSLLMLAAGAVTGFAGALLTLTPKLIRRVLVVACSAVVIAGVFQELIQIILQTSVTLTAVNDQLYTWEGLTPRGAVIIFIVVVGITLVGAAIARVRHRDPPALAATERKRGQLIAGGVVLLGLIVLPLVAGAYIGQVMMLVGLYILMGMRTQSGGRAGRAARSRLRRLLCRRR